MILPQKVLVKCASEMKFGHFAARKMTGSPKGKLDAEKEHDRNLIK